MAKDNFDIDLDLHTRDFAKHIAGMPDWAIDTIVGGIPYTLGIDLRRSAGVEVMSRYIKLVIDATER